MVRPDLIGPAGNTRQVAAIRKLQFEGGLILNGLRQRKGFPQPLWLHSIKALGVLDELDYLVFFLCLHQHTAGRCLHGMEGQVSHACPRNHQVPRLLKKVNSALVNEVEDVSKIFVWREVLIGPWAVLFQPVFGPLFSCIA